MCTFEVSSFRGRHPSLHVDEGNKSRYQNTTIQCSMQLRRYWQCTKNRSSIMEAKKNCESNRISIFWRSSTFEAPSAPTSSKPALLSWNSLSDLIIIVYWQLEWFKGVVSFCSVDSMTSCIVIQTEIISNNDQLVLTEWTTRECDGIGGKGRPMKNRFGVERLREKFAECAILNCLVCGFIRDPALAEVFCIQPQRSAA